jgi:glycosyltransferase involved in cell wall biosynthesis
VKTVLLDVRRATWRPHLGISRYARALLNAIGGLKPADLRIAPVDLAGSAEWSDLEPVEVRGNQSFVGRMAQEQVSMALATRHADLLHLPWYEGPALPRCPLVVSVHDTDTVDRPRGHRWRFRAYYNSLLRIYVRTARRILVPSQASMDALESRWPGRPYVLVPLAVDEVFVPQPGGGKPRSPVVLYSGGFEQRKRLPDLLAAFDEIAQREPDVRLVITGEPDEEALRGVKSAKAGDRIDLVGRVDEPSLAELYRTAAVVAYPSEREGFGFPVLEGFASGTPVVACDSGSVPEVAGGAALLVPPRSPRDLADALHSVLTDSAVAERLRAAGLQRARAFSWERTARLTLDAYREALA